MRIRCRRATIRRRLLGHLCLDTALPAAPDPLSSLFLRTAVNSTFHHSAIIMRITVRTQTQFSLSRLRLQCLNPLHSSSPRALAARSRVRALRPIPRTPHRHHSQCSPMTRLRHPTSSSRLRRPLLPPTHLHIMHKASAPDVPNNPRCRRTPDTYPNNSSCRLPCSPCSLSPALSRRKPLHRANSPSDLQPQV